MAKRIHLTHQEATDLVLSILEGVSFVEGEDDTIRSSWAMEMRAWCLDILDRIHDTT